MEPRQGAHTVGREKFVFVQHAREHAPQLLAVHQRQQAAHAARGPLGHFDVLGNVRMIVDEPLHAALEARQAIHDFRLERFHREKRNKANHRADLEEMLASVG